MKASRDCHTIVCILLAIVVSFWGCPSRDERNLRVEDVVEVIPRDCFSGAWVTLDADLQEARLSVFKYIETFYNPVRIHQTLGYLSPDQFEAENAPALVA